MIIWNQQINEQEILSLPQEQVMIDFKDMNILSSYDFKKIFLLCREFRKSGRHLVFRISSPQLKGILTELGLDKLGVDLISL